MKSVFSLAVSMICLLTWSCENTSSHSKSLFNAPGDFASCSIRLPDIRETEIPGVIRIPVDIKTSQGGTFEISWDKNGQFHGLNAFAVPVDNALKISALVGPEHERPKISLATKSALSRSVAVSVVKADGVTSQGFISHLQRNILCENTANKSISTEATSTYHQDFSTNACGIYPDKGSADSVAALHEDIFQVFGQGNASLACGKYVKVQTDSGTFCIRIVDMRGRQKLLDTQAAEFKPIFGSRAVQDGTAYFRVILNNGSYFERGIVDPQLMLHDSCG
ncbi:hypothetical protein [Oligoflexus tunisiensis]|uniref:hypothetical protein n=1 Tax=Oligoflexus tunisiensis TaxID=708132 RepID=UPI00114CF214|nr:hypothetical protein [Oligoflexus tunisiensis]